MGDELKVSYGSFDGSKNGWISYIFIYSDGIQIYTDNFVVSYEALSGKKQPTEAELENFAAADEYDRNIDMYNSLLTRGNPIIYFEIDYNVTAESDDKPSEYRFNFSKIRVINKVSGKVTQTSSLNKVQPRTMKPEWDLREIVGIVDKEESNFEILKKHISKELTLTAAKEAVARIEKVNALFDRCGIKMVDIPGKTYSMLNTEVTQKLYTSVMGSNPSYFNGVNNQVENVSWFDAVYFCNKFSEKFGFAPVYSVNGTTDVSERDYKPHYGNSIRGGILQNSNANGFRLPTQEEWEYAAKGGQNYEYSGSDNLDEVGWYGSNSGGTTHPVAQKKANGYGLYDMSGNVRELCGDGYDSYGHRNFGGDFYNYAYYCIVHGHSDYNYNSEKNESLGFRIVCSVFNYETSNAQVKVNSMLTVTENLRIRSDETTSSKVFTIMQAGTRVKILQLG